MAEIYNEASDTLISGTGGNDSIYNCGANVTITAGKGKDTITNENSSAVSIDAGAGNDIIYNYDSQVTIDADKGNDIIWNWGSNVEIDGGKGSNVIKLSGDNEFVKVGAGANTIKASSSFSVEDFGADDVIDLEREISNLETVDGGIVADGITISGISDIATVKNSWSTKTNSITCNRAKVAGAKLDGSKIIYNTKGSSKKIFTITGINSSIGISEQNKVVTVAAAALNKGKVSISKGYTLALADDVAKIETTPAGWTLSDTTATYKTAYTSAGYKLADNKISYVKESGGKILVTVTGVKSLDGLSLKNKTVKISNAALDKDAVSISGNGYKLALANDVNTTKETISEWTTLDNGNVAYQVDGTGAYYTLNKAKTAIIYTPPELGTNQVELSGINGTPTLKNGVVSLKASNFTKNARVESNASGYSFSLSGNFKNKTFTGTAKADTIKSSGSNIAINGDAGNDSLVGGKNNDELYGGADNDTIKGDKGNDTLWGGAGDDKLYGGAGNDVFVYKPNEGTDKIYDYAAVDMLKILKTDGKEGGSFTKAEFSGGNLTLTIDGGGTVIFDSVSKVSKFNINGNHYTIKGNTLKMK